MLPMLPAIAWDRLAPRVGTALRERVHTMVLNRAITARLEPCDVFIGMSGLILEAARAAKDRFGARIFYERGSQHILAQKDILLEAGAIGPSSYAVERELASYNLADRILVPSRQAAATFDRRGAAEKVVVNTYGVDLQMFPRRTAPPEGPPTVLFVGRWDYQKGADILAEAILQLTDAQLLHVGPLGDAPFPSGSRFIHCDPVDQHALGRFYRAAHVHVLASRQDGLGMVQLQALASGLPLICTDRTGGRDLAFSAGLARRIDEVPAGNPVALAAAIRARLDSLQDLPEITDEDRDRLSWRHYAERYSETIDRALAAGGGL
jgi:glycosyltransferase involved in cell wall biosynthesis